MDKEQINNLLAKHLVGETNEAEEAIVLDWIKANPEEYLKLKVLWTDAYAPNNKQLFSADKAWQNVVNKIGFNELQHQPTIKPKQTKYWFAAAAILVVSTLSLFIYATSHVTVVTQLAQIKTINLSDGSLVTLNENSSLSYPRYFFTQRNIELKGEAFFEVKRNTEKPFNVATNNLQVQVLGTSFLVNNVADAAFVKVKSGKVSVKDVQQNASIFLTKGQGATLVGGELIKENINNDNYLAWKTKELIFTENSLKDVFSTIENYYHVKIVTDNIDSLNCKVTTKFNNQTLTAVLKELQLLFGFTFNIVDNKVTISAITCL